MSHEEWRLATPMMQVSAQAMACHIVVNISFVSDDNPLRRQTRQPQLGAVGEYPLDSEGGVAASHGHPWSPASVPRGEALGHTHGEGEATGCHAHDAGKY